MNTNVRNLLIIDYYYVTVTCNTTEVLLAYHSCSILADFWTIIASNYWGQLLVLALLALLPCTCFLLALSIYCCFF